MSEAAWSEAYADPDLTHLMRAVVALMAAAEVAKQAGNPARAGDLVDVAFLELSTFRQLAQKVSRVLAPFPFETLEDRRQRLLTYADRLRATLSESDWTAIETSASQIAAVTQPLSSNHGVGSSGWALRRVG